jgi:pyruvate/2-oxoglutarate dehydrogenase complex dihydrolipoamide acyltransferase (E2) component
VLFVTLCRVNPRTRRLFAMAALRAANSRIGLKLKGLLSILQGCSRGQMHIHRQWQLALLLIGTVFAVPAQAQTPSEPAPAAAAPANPAAAPAKKPAKPKKPPAKPAEAAPAPAVPAAPPAAATKPVTPPKVGGVKPTLLGQYGEWGAYTASPGGKKLCFAIAKPTSAETNPPNRPRNPIYMFVSTRPADNPKVVNEVSIIAGYPFKPGSEASAAVGSTTYALYTQQDGAWIKNAPEEAQMVDAMRAGQTAVVKGTSAKGTESTDTYSLKGLSQALDRVGQECK